MIRRQEGRITQSFRVEKALVSIGRVPNLQGLGLERAGVKLVNGCLEHRDGQTSVPNIWAVCHACR
jgi:dihydrolipoamide dehydrogenase